MFTVSLYVLEKDSEDDEISARFHNVLVGLPHGLIHLTGVARLRNESCPECKQSQASDLAFHAIGC